jgi:acyl-homoserine lactone synthase
MRIEVICPADRSANQALLTQAFALRHHVFVEQRGWDFLRDPDCLDVDRHDRGAATHVLVLERDRVQGHVRLIPGGYLAVARANPILLRQAVADANVYGLSRFCISPQLRGAFARRAFTACLFTAALREVIERGSYALLFDTDPYMIFMLRMLGFALEDVGEPVAIAGRLMQPIVLRLDASVLSALPMKIANWIQGTTAAVPDWAKVLS